MVYWAARLRWTSSTGAALLRPSWRRFSSSCSYSGAAITGSADMGGVDLPRALLDLGQVEHPRRLARRRRRQGGRPPAGLAHGAHVVGAHLGDLLQGQLHGRLVPLAEQLANLVQVVGGVAAQPLDAALHEPLVLRERPQERLPLVGQVAGVAGPIQPLLVLGQAGGVSDAVQQPVAGDLAVAAHHAQLVADLLAVDQLAR